MCEALVIHSALWGDPDELLDAIDADLWRLDLFRDHLLTAGTILAVVTSGRVPWPEVVAAELVAAGTDPIDAMAAVDPPGAFEAAGCRCGGLAHWLARLTAERRREAVEAAVLAAANVLHLPDGADLAVDRLREVVPA